MVDERQPDETFRVAVDGHEVVVYSFGTGPEVLFCLSGGPGLPCDYVRESHSHLADRGYRVVIHDQLGTGASDRPADRGLWTAERFIEEVETVRRALDLGPVHLLGQSWGGMLGFVYTLAYPDSVVSFVDANGTPDVPLYLGEVNLLRVALGPETVAMMTRHEAEGTTDHPAYQAAVTILNHRHVCRLPVWPAPLLRSMTGNNMEVYGTMWGPNEFTCIGNLKDWGCLDQLGGLERPVLVLAGLHDEMTPAMVAATKNALPNATARIFDNSSHTPYFEEPEAYTREVLGFLDRHRVHRAAG